MTKRSITLMTAILIVFLVALFSLWKSHPEYIPHAMVIASLLIYLVCRTQEYRANDTPDDFFLYDREMPRNQFVPTYVTTNIGLFSSIAYSVILAYYYGIAGMLFTTLAWFLGMYWFSKKIPTLLSFFKTGTTIHEFIANSYGKSQHEKAVLRAWTSGVTSILYFASIGVEIKFAAIMLTPSMGQFQATVLAFSIAFCGLTYAYLSGYKGVVYTDKIQYYIMLIGAGVIAIFVFLIGADHNFSFANKAFETYFNFPFVILGPEPWSLFGMIVLLALYQFCIMDMWQRCIAFSKTKNEKGESLSDPDLIALLKRKTFRDAILPFLILFLVWFMIGIVVLGTNLTDDVSKILPAFLGAFKSFGSWGYFAEAIVITGFVAAALSTVDGFLIVTVQTLMYDIYGTVVVKGLSDNLSKLEKYQQYRFVNISKLGIVVVGFLSVMFAFVKFGLMNFWTTMYSIMLSFFPAVYEGIHMRQNKYNYSAVFYSVLIGSFGALIFGIAGTFLLNNAVLASVLTAMAPVWALLSSAIILKFFGRK